VPVDPTPDLRRIGGNEYLSGIRGRVLSVRTGIEQLGGVESQHRTRRDADAFTRNCAQHERAGGEARPVQDNALARSLEHRKELQVGEHVPAAACRDTHIREHRRETGQEKDGRDGYAMHLQDFFTESPAEDLCNLSRFIGMSGATDRGMFMPAYASARRAALPIEPLAPTAA
jgi:hypothetical protein